MANKNIKKIVITSLFHHLINSYADSTLECPVPGSLLGVAVNNLDQSMNQVGDWRVVYGQNNNAFAGSEDFVQWGLKELKVV